MARLSSAAPTSATVLARILTVVYFLFFFLMPWYTARDRDEAGPGKSPMNKLMLALAWALSTLFAATAHPALASTGNDLRMEPPPAHRLDEESLQRGARTFVNYCLNCHSAGTCATTGSRHRPDRDADHATT